MTDRRTAPAETPAHAPGTPALPATPLRFILYFVACSRWPLLAMVLLETANAACGIMIPYALNRVIGAVTGAHQRSLAVMAALRLPLLMFVAFTAGEVLFGRLAAALQFRLGPRQRQRVTRALFHYVQHHSHRFLSETFAGALAHRIGE